MKKNMLMKREIAKTLKELCETKNLEDIRVNGLCNCCGINRGTFYYHFLDLYDLIIWIFETELAAPAEAWIRAGECAGLGEFCLNTLLSGQSFYCKALRQIGQNSLYGYMQKRSDDCWRLLLEQRLAAAGKTPEMEGSHEILVRFASQAVCGMVLDWVQKGMETPVSELLKVEEAVVWGVYNRLDKRRNRC